MELAVRILDEAPTEPVIAVDGALGAAGLELSHWPGNRTPRELRHRLSTGSALAFARLPPERRRALAAGATAIANNHYDTDGTLALFAVRRPAEALARAEALLRAAEAGDFFRFPDEAALALDATIGGLVDPERSPWRAQLAGLSDRERREHATLRLLDELPALLDGELERYRPLWEPVLTAALHDRADLARATRDEVVHLDLTVWTAARDATSTRPGGTAGDGGARFDPGRHALFGASEMDRVLVIGPGRAGTSYRFLLSTLSWFDLDEPRLPRPDLLMLAERLNALEGTRPEDEGAWRAEAAAGPSPELWFGAREHELFAEHAPVLAPSALAPALVRRELADALRASLPV